MECSELENTFVKFESGDNREERQKYMRRPTAYRNQKDNSRKPFELENQSINILDLLPTMESHYYRSSSRKQYLLPKCRSSSRKHYLLPEWFSKEELHRFYKKDSCVSKSVQPLAALFRSKQNECKICSKFKERF
ncbi:hypothetical protein QE152_g3652 [Popillia japonica]|uniref:Uncharacterized protein n=1 Tax=Popillia japonica TaxID=7064 RepID=A0AAW1N019_POPJA